MTTYAEWVSWDIAEGIEWYTVEDETTTYHYTTRQTRIPMEDDHDFADDSTLYYATKKRSGSAWQTGNSGALRSLFIESGTLDNARDTDFRQINAEGFPGFSHSVDLGTISSTAQPDPVVWAIGLVRNPLIRYTSLSRDQTGYYWSVHPNISSVITAFLNDFEDVRSRSVALDAMIMSAATEVSSEYADVLSLLTRQIFASLDITLEKTEGGNIDPSATKIFMKDMGVSKSRRTNPVDVMYGAFPAFVYFNTTIARDLLLPYFELQENSPYAAPDIGKDSGACSCSITDITQGTKYPTISDPTDPDTLAIDNTGSMLIMAYAHAVKSGDGSLVSRYRWADFLVSTTLNPLPGSRTIDDFRGPGKANLVIKGILAIFSMAKMNEATGSSNTTYMLSLEDHAIALYQNWTQQAVTETHIKYIYDVPESWGLMYNLFPDIWLNMNMISNDTLTHQADFYKNQTGEQSALGVQNFHNDTVFPHWTLLTAATIPDNMSDIRDQFISSIHQRVFNGSEYFSLPIKYKSSTGEGIGGGASGSAMFGTAYGLLARRYVPPLDMPVFMTKNFSQPNVDFVVHPYSPPRPARNIGTTAGGVIGGVVGVALIALGLYFCNRRRRATQEKGWRRYIQPHPFARVHSSPAEAELVRLSRPDSPVLAKRRLASGHGNNFPIRGVSPASYSMSENSSSDARPEEIRAEISQLRRELESVRDRADLPPAYT
ncbi:hypothetical protein D9756_005174 [Leucocoprinus leucothites]|uniref:DUF1793-domain-containing protein n=1 Tax=Leucocoprinus leucothites TaxID=201217 RepID=A0A8H5GA14_9AGAR|nr:hypothetical protein D9756_005174 [Leucoagaricus leucothites]